MIDKQSEDKIQTCACVHYDAYECARIRDGRHLPDEAEYQKRACECICHDNDDADDDWDWIVK